MVEKICLYLTKQIQKSNPEIDDQRAEVINYGLQNIVGEFPKIILLFITGFILGIGQLTIISFLAILPYRAFSGGFHLKTHLGCIIGTTLFFCGNVFLSKNIEFPGQWYQYVFILAVWIFSIIAIKKYAPADTEDVPILSKKRRKKLQGLSYITMSITLLIATFINNIVISNILVIGVLLQSISITKCIYKITNNKYGYEVYN